MHIIVQIYNLFIRSTTLISKGVQYHLKFFTTQGAINSIILLDKEIKK